VMLHTPSSPFVIDCGPLPCVTSPTSSTPVACGARSRNVTVRSAWISGERSVDVGPPARPAPTGVTGACAARLVTSAIAPAHVVRCQRMLITASNGDVL
jgi:hypothetical protein